MTDEDTGGFLSLAAFCKRYDVSRNTVYREIGAGRLTAVKVGAATRITKASAERWARSLPKFVPGEGERF